ncbi:1-aminocyclopropane-1-carboxylate oxidase-like protein 12-like [Cucumis melo var. makuwa]|uniref:1-aminocyclopropane-1-carboxylate oxidase-like protein 12-like n=1 Tax=Cucumis melo var. makuwa TaxID=1194695 RepID=A0A5D3D410_CUCMM|nr:1-aminocyclopropane-1-carboxylate oxidase-like protein 12-like [Cucumis melo var. makuwa]TYK18278.1 1-aminocyclopropane-1-carboxylate oxidase-like protein 12-like [Cucumis melo var. makuwa]
MGWVGEIPVIDLRGIGRRAEEVVREIGEACERWGIFHMVNHGIPNGVMKKVLEAIGEFMSNQKKRR